MAGRREHRSEDVRQGKIILRKPLQKAIFLAGLAGLVAFPLALALAHCVQMP